MQPSSNIRLAAKYIQEGKLVAFPTETVYGLGADALNPYAVAKIFERKERPAFDPLIVHIADISDLSKLMEKPDERVLQLADRFWPGPLTVVVPKSKLVPDIVTAGLPTVGIRMPNHPVALELIRLSGCPIAAPSANKFGRVSPTQAHHVTRHLPEVDLVLDGGPTTVGIESTIIQLHQNGFELLRHGAVTREDIEKIIPYHASSERHSGIVAPGMLKSHYSPTKPLHIMDEVVLKKIDRQKSGLLSFSGNDTDHFKKVIRLSNDGNLQEYAVKLFAAIHQMQEEDVETIIVEPVPESGIGIAIMDRLRKAAYEHRLK